MMMKSSLKLEYGDELFGKEDTSMSFSFLNYSPSLSSHQSELTSPFFELEDEFLSFPNYNDFLPSASSFLALPDLEPISIVSHEDLLSEYGSVPWNKEESMFDEHKRQDFDLVEKNESTTTKKRKCNYASSCFVSQPLSKETIRLHFYKPITQAAKELNTGVTLLKKRCRELGIQRWPHRKLTSILKIINKIKLDLEKMVGDKNKDKLINALEKLEKERKKIEEFPDLKFDDKTMRLRQASFKANHMRKRKLVMSTSITSSSPSSSSSSSYSHASSLSDDSCLIVVDEEVREDDDEEVKYLLYGFSHVGYISL